MKPPVLATLAHAGMHRCSGALRGARVDCARARSAECAFQGVLSAVTCMLSSVLCALHASHHRWLGTCDRHILTVSLAVQLLADEGGRRLMVFCNSVQSCRAVDHHLVEAGFSTVCFHGDVPAPARKTAIAQFTDAAVASSAQQPVLVCTDLAARGIDMPARVDHVINFDMPSNPVWYLHRSGRTARAGADGAVTSLMQSAMERTLGQRIERALTNSEPLDQLSGVKEDPNLRNHGRGGAAPQEQRKSRGNNHRKWQAQSKQGKPGSGAKQGKQLQHGEQGRAGRPAGEQQQAGKPPGRGRRPARGSGSGRRRVGTRAVGVAMWGAQMSGPVLRARL